MLPVQPLIAGVLVPLVVSSVIWFLGGRFVQNRRLLAPVAVGAAFMSAQVGLSGFPDFPASEASNWLFWLSPVVVTLVPMLSRLPQNLARTLYLIGLVGVLCLILKPMIEWHWTTPLQYLGWPAAFTLGGLANAHAFAQTRESRWFKLLLPATFGMTAGLLAASGSLMLGQLSGATAVSLTPIAFKGGPVTSPSLTALLTLLLTTLLAMGICYANLHPLIAGSLVLMLQVPALLPLKTTLQSAPTA